MHPDFEAIYNNLISLLQDDIPELCELSPSGRNYQPFPKMRKVHHFEWGFPGHGAIKKYFMIQIHFENDKEETNLYYLNKVIVNKEKIENETGEGVIIEEHWDPGEKYASRMYIKKDISKYGNNLLSEDFLQWAKRTTLIFYKNVNGLL
ncbi:DUF4268 domain-containing protein [Treponema primitia]|uniref:hypothetical protein n=1 Tax=Treponema primitia TaxID=88058 RepID=UPI00397ED2E6